MTSSGKIAWTNDGWSGGDWLSSKKEESKRKVGSSVDGSWAGFEARITGQRANGVTTGSSRRDTIDLISPGNQKRVSKGLRGEEGERS